MQLLRNQFVVLKTFIGAKVKRLQLVKMVNVEDSISLEKEDQRDVT